MFLRTIPNKFSGFSSLISTVITLKFKIPRRYVHSNIRKRLPSAKQPNVRKRFPSSRTFSDRSLPSIIQEHTEVSRNHMTPEIGLHLITPSCPLWTADPQTSPFQDPYWAFYWPGGQAIARCLLDHPEIVAGKKVLDLGSGSGACAIAAAKAGAELVLANDIDKVAATAVQMNAEVNDVQISVLTQNLVGKKCDAWQCVLVGDLFYDTEFAGVLLPWLEELSKQGKQIIIGDPGRSSLTEHTKNAKHFCSLATYTLPSQCCLENSGFTHGFVWRF